MLLFAVLFAAVAIAAPTNNLVVHERRSYAHDLIVKGPRADPDALIEFRIALTQNNLDEGYDHLMRISDPDSPDYGKHWTIEEIHSKFAPSEDSVTAVKAWLEDFGIHRDHISESTSKQWLAVHISAKDAERLLDAEYYEHDDGNGKMRIGCDRYHVPSHLARHIDYVTPGIMYSAPVKKTKAKRNPYANSNLRRSVHSDRALNISATSLANCGQYMTPACIRALYGIPKAHLNQAANALGVFEIDPETYDQRDLQLFFSHFAPWVPNGTHPSLISINNATAPVKGENYGSEALLDFNLAFSLLYPQSVTLYQTRATGLQLETYRQRYANSNLTQLNIQYLAQNREVFDPLLDAIDGNFCTNKLRDSGHADCGTAELTKVLSVSYSTSELSMPESAVRRACHEYMKLALKGHTLVIASGDYGPAGHTLGGNSNECINPGHIENLFLNGTVFNPQFPSSCPYVLSVGGTQLERNQSVHDPESAMHLRNYDYPPDYTFSSSGGRSNYFSTPKYQKSTVNTYFKNHDPGYPTYIYTGKKSVGTNGGLYASGGRAFPDVSANGAHFPMFVGGEFTPGEGGTSMSTPIWASIITMINQQRSCHGKGPVGFINPVIYKHPEVFNDITTGTAPGCGTAGFPVCEGWDAVTGLGTPNYPKLLKLFLSLP